MTSTGPTITAGITTKRSPRSIEETVARLIELIAGRGMKLFDVIDQSAEARRVGLHLRLPPWSFSVIPSLGPL